MSISQPDPDAAFHIVLNAGSGHEDTAFQRETIEGVMRAAGRRFELNVVDPPEALAELAQQAVDKARASGGIVVAAGGDGTINTIARMAVAAACPFGVLPQGTFNYFGRTHGVPEDLAESARALLDSRVLPVQVGLVNGHVFLVNASIGLYPRLLEERERDKAAFGRSRLVAFLSALKTVFGRFRHLRIALEIDGHERHLNTPTLFVGNNRLQLEQVGVAPLSEAIADGQLAALAPHAVGTLGMLGLLVRGAAGRLGDADNVAAFGFRQMTVRYRGWYRRRRIKVATDGEVRRLDMPLHFSVLEGCLFLLVPSGREGKGAEAAAT